VQQKEKGSEARNHQETQISLTAPAACRSLELVDVVPEQESTQHNPREKLQQEGKGERIPAVNKESLLRVC